MKRCWVVLTVFGLLIPMLVMAAVEIPAPFGRAREMALTVKPNEAGNYLIRIEFNEDGRDFAYIIGYLPSYNLIGIGNLVDGVVFEFNTETGEFTVWTYMGRMPIAKEQIPEAIAEAFGIFRVLVAKGLI